MKKKLLFADYESEQEMKSFNRQLWEITGGDIDDFPVGCSFDGGYTWTKRSAPYTLEWKVWSEKRRGITLYKETTVQHKINTQKISEMHRLEQENQELKATIQMLREGMQAKGWKG
jgi:hypothetical protein